MKRVCAIVLALCITVGCILGADIYIKSALGRNVSKAIYYNGDTRNSCTYFMEKLVNKESILVLGSSELSSSDDIAYPAFICNQGNSDFNMILVGRGYMQSLSHAINVGALQDSIKNNKVVLILSPQWFTQEHLAPEAFASLFDETVFFNFLRNDRISEKTKTAVSNRVNQLLETDAATLERVKKYEDITINDELNPVSYLEMYSYNLFREFRLRYQLNKELSDINESESKGIKFEDIDFDALMEKAEQAGREECTNNSFGINNEYYNSYVKDNYESSKNSNINGSYTSSPEYGDLRLFLDVCKETGIDPLIVSVPCNGRWYDYTGFPKENRQQYYQDIRDICDEYDVELADFSYKEYELYFLKDVMHMGWKGWVYFDEAVYEFYKK